MVNIEDYFTKAENLFKEAEERFPINLINGDDYTVQILKSSYLLNKAIYLQNKEIIEFLRYDL